MAPDHAPVHSPMGSDFLSGFFHGEARHADSVWPSEVAARILVVNSHDNPLGSAVERPLTERIRRPHSNCRSSTQLGLRLVRFFFRRPQPAELAAALDTGLPVRQAADPAQAKGPHRGPAGRPADGPAMSTRGGSIRVTDRPCLGARVFALTADPAVPTPPERGVAGRRLLLGCIGIQILRARKKYFPD